MKTNKHKILVLTDFRNSAPATLENTMVIAKKMDADIELFHVKNPFDIIDTENQVLALRLLSGAHFDAQKSFGKLLSSIKENEVNVKYSFEMGRVKKEITKKIENYQPDLIVVGKRTKNPLKLSRDKLTNYLIKTASCPIMIASSQKNADSQTNLVPAYYNDSLSLFSQHKVWNKLQADLDTIREYRIISDKDEFQNRTINRDPKRIQYLFDRNDNAFGTISKYLSKNKINLFCIQWENRLNKDCQSLIDKVDVSLLIAGKTNTPIQLKIN